MDANQVPFDTAAPELTVRKLNLKGGQVAMFGYGSLILLESMQRTLGRRYEGERYDCSLRGWKRVWTSLYPNEKVYFLGPGGERSYPKNILYLNISEAPASMSVNGVVYIISEPELEAFDKREAVYDRIDVAAGLSDLNVAGGPVWVYVGKAPYVMIDPLPLMEAAIRASYLDIIEKGLAEMGPEFRRHYEGSSEPAPRSNVINDLAA
jgi:hypothetical protein